MYSNLQIKVLTQLWRTRICSFKHSVNCDHFQLLSTTFNYFQLLNAKCNCSQLLTTASYYLQLLSNCFQLLTTAHNCSQLLTNLCNRSNKQFLKINILKIEWLSAEIKNQIVLYKIPQMCDNHDIKINLTKSLFGYLFNDNNRAN